MSFCLVPLKDQWASSGVFVSNRFFRESYLILQGRKQESQYFCGDGSTNYVCIPMLPEGNFAIFTSSLSLFRPKFLFEAFVLKAVHSIIPDQHFGIKHLDSKNQNLLKIYSVHYEVFMPSFDLTYLRVTIRAYRNTACSKSSQYLCSKGQGYRFVTA